ncbi:hypothetical protein [Pseudoduganella albidiflava]|uniref:Uncharacterized protein n=1 Tax=Pseudoduganella albidiflava TaxID=321983 RepID=A0A411X191_9BURK|nr:hypothetical protein [Pseudoduganella albidiflava]QBI02744.1 hypothetical protein EYF70_19235 [Pseudoduganella albidiflava]GGY55951.1 hypothetical protein GCM10007387_42960 [Pseudoduganella albidiflava]
MAAAARLAIHPLTRSLIRSTSRAAVALAVCAASAGSALANPVVAAVAAAPSGIALTVAASETPAGAGAVREEEAK